MYEAEELAAAEAKGLLHPDGDRPDRAATTQRLVEVLTERHRVESIEQIEERAGSIVELTDAIFGHTGDELRRFVGSLCIAQGAVQGKLNGDGLMLCASKVRSEVTERGKTFSKPIGVRYVTTVGEAIVQDVVDVAIDKAVGTIARQNKILELTLDRQPTLVEAVRQARVAGAERIERVLLPAWTQGGEAAPNA